MRVLFVMTVQFVWALLVMVGLVMLRHCLGVGSPLMGMLVWVLVMGLMLLSGQCVGVRMFEAYPSFGGIAGIF